MEQEQERIDRQVDQEVAQDRADDEALAQREGALARAKGFLSVFDPGLAEALALDPEDEDALGALSKFDEATSESLAAQIRRGNDILNRRHEVQEREIAQTERSSKLDALRRQRQAERDEAEEKRRAEEEQAELQRILDEEDAPTVTPAAQQDLELRAFSDAVERHDTIQRKSESGRPLPLTADQLEERAEAADAAIAASQRLVTGTPDQPLDLGDPDQWLASWNAKETK